MPLYPSNSRLGATTFKSDVTPAPHFLTSLAVLFVFWMKTASDVTLEPMSVTSLNKNEIKDYLLVQDTIYIDGAVFLLLLNRKQYDARP